MNRRRAGSVLLLVALLAGGLRAAERRTAPTPYVRGDASGGLTYVADERGNRVIDFSAAGYGGGGVALPLVPVQVVVAPQPGHDRECIQAAIDRVAALPLQADGFRGAVLLERGRFEIDGESLHLNASGVVLRGSGEGEEGTVLVAQRNFRRTLLEVRGRGTRTEIAGTRQPVTDAFVGAGATELSVENAAAFPVGARVLVRRPSNAAWIAAIEMNTMPGWRTENRIQWAPGSRDLTWERVVVAVNGNRVTLDAPLTTALDRAYGSGTIARYEFPGRIDHVGVEQLRCVADFDPAQPQDEEHAWAGIVLDQVEHAWVRQVTLLHFVTHAVATQADATAVTIEDCTTLAPVSELAGYRRRVFSIGGQLTLVQRCTSERGLHDFTLGFVAAGPNVFRACTAREALGPSGPMESWASGILYDGVIIRGDALRFLNRGAAAQGSGWTAANAVLWNCEATELQVQSPPGALNQAYGCKGVIADDREVYDPRWMPWRDFVRGSAVEPASLYAAQLRARKGPAAIAALERVPVSVERGFAPMLSRGDVPVPVAPPRGPELRVVDAQFMLGGQRAWTSSMNYSWYLGQMPRPLARSFGPALTRFSPAENGPGATDRVEDVVNALSPGGVFVQHYGLWYDRRRINHNFYGSPELPAEDATPPFMEMPWARSGQGRDWNGLSKYDLTRFNPWYFQRVKAFADLADVRGRILYFNFYFQHALQETRAHYVDFPWRPVNCLQATDLPDENPAANAFYDIAHPVRRDLHRRYIRHCLDVLAANGNVVFGIDREYSGPLPFVQFWLDTIGEWQREHGRKVWIALEVPKAEMDALLDDPVRGPLIAAVDFHHWFYRPDGSLFAIEGGRNEAPREQNVGVLAPADVAALRERVNYPGNIVNAPEFQAQAQRVRASTPALRYRALREYRDAFPALVLLRRGDDFPALSAAIDRGIPRDVRSRTRPAELVRDQPTTAWCMAERGRTYVVYAMTGQPTELDLTGARGEFAVAWVSETSPEPIRVAELIRGGASVTLTPPTAVAGHPAVAWLSRR